MIAEADFLRRKLRFMQTKWEKIEGNTALLEVEVEEERVNDALDRAFKKVVKQVVVPGFRKGKVPRKIFEAKFGVESLYRDALDILLPEVYPAAVEEAKIEPVDRPDIDVIQLEKGKPLIFKAKVTVKPEVILGEYKGLPVEEKDVAVTPEDVAKELENLRKSHASIVVVEDGTVENGDTVLLDFEGYMDGAPFEGGQAENYQLEIGTGTFVAGFEEQLIGMARGEEKEITVRFPDDYHAEHLRGKEAVFKVRIHEIKRKELPELDDEFAKDISEFDTLDELKADLENKLKEKAERDKKAYMEQQVVDQAVANATIDVPDVMIRNEIEHMYADFENRLRMQGIALDLYFQFMNTTPEKIKEEMRESAEKRVRTALVLEAIGKAEEIEVTEKDIEAELTKIAESAKLDVDKVKEIFSSRGQLDSLKAEILTRKTVDFLLTHSKTA
jgi:trigger factor